jgi:hypothetical protein
VPFQRKKQPAIGTKGLYPGLIEPALASYGEVVVPAADGSTDFAVLQNELKGQSTKIVLVAIDLLYLMGVALRRSAMAVDARLRILRRRDRDDVSADRDVAQ